MTTTEKPTREQIEAMEAGPELDELAAQFMMGWQACGQDEPFRKHVHRGGCIVNGIPEKFGIGIIPKPWSPSTDISAAMELIEKMNDRMWSFTLLPDEGVWQVRFIDEVPMPEFEDASLPLAITKAAIIASISKG